MTSNKAPNINPTFNSNDALKRVQACISDELQRPEHIKPLEYPSTASKE
jgi:hypothetical protein